MLRLRLQKRLVSSFLMRESGSCFIGGIGVMTA